MQLKVAQAAPPAFDGSSASALAWLRWADACVPVSASLGVTGAALVFLGAACAAHAAVSAYPWLAALLLGVLCLLAAALAHHGGLVSFLPLVLQDVLLRTTPFDFLVDETELTNVARRWGRLLLLAGERSEGEIQMILRGLDYEFLDTVFRRGMVHMLPEGLRLLLLPNLQPAPAALARAQEGAGARPARWWAGGLGSLVARCGKPPCKGRGEVRQVDLTPAGIHELLRRKEEERRFQATEPALGPVVGSLVPKPFRQALKQLAYQSLQLATVASATSAGAWITSACFFCTPSARSTLRALAFGGQASAGSGERASRAALCATGLSLACAGGSLAVALRIQRRWLPRTRPPPDAPGAGALGPEAAAEQAPAQAAPPRP